jgi:hypothetical protein
LSAVDALEHTPVYRGARVNGRGLLRVDSEGADAALGESEGDGGAMELMAAICALADTISGSRVDDLAVRGVDCDRERLQRSGRRVQRPQGLPRSAGIGAEETFPAESTAAAWMPSLPEPPKVRSLRTPWANPGEMVNQTRRITRKGIQP